MKVHMCDVLVIGSGGAALRAAIEAKEYLLGGKVTILTKGRLGESGVTATACSDRMAFHATLEYTEPGGPDNWRYHADDVFRIGGFVSDEDLAIILARNSADALYYLDRLGVPFVRTSDGRIDQFVTDGSRYARAAYTGPYTAVDIERALVRKVRSLDIAVVEQHVAACLLMDERRRRVAGVLALDTNEDPSGMPVQFVAKSVVMATGGAGQVFAVNVFPPENTGEGYAMAYDAGAELVNMEFVQIGIASVATRLACSGSIPRSVPRVINDKGEEFLPRYMPEFQIDDLYNVLFEKGASWPVQCEHRSSRLDVAIHKEMQVGRRVFLDFSRNPVGFNWDRLLPELKDRYESEVKNPLGPAARYASPLKRYLEINPESVEWFKERGIDLERGDLVEIAPAAQHFQGGIKIRTRAETTIPGLFAAGECAGGQHGANRPGGHALLDCQVFGRLAGREAALEARHIKGQVCPSETSLEAAIRRIESLREGPGIPASAARARLQRTVSRCAGVFRTEKGLSEGIAEVADIKAEGIAADDRGLAYAVETAGMLHVAEMVLRAARMRRESRGPHLFFDSDDDMVPLPRNDGNWCRYIVIRKGQESEMRLETRKPVRVSAV